MKAGLSTWSLKPYVEYKFKGEPYSGYKRWNYDRIDELAAIIRKANENGLSLEFHAIGSGAARYALDVIEKAQADFVVYDVDFTDETVMADPKVCGIPAKSMYINGEKIY